MKNVKSVLLVSVFMGSFGLGTASAKDGILNSVKSEQSNYCHMHFPAMNENTLSWNSPVLKDSNSGDIIHFYGSCDYDPHGKDAVQAQKRDQQRRWQREYSSE